MGSNSYPLTLNHSELLLCLDFYSLILDLGHCVAIRARIRSGSPNQPTIGVRSLLDDLPTTELTPRIPGQILDAMPKSYQRS